MLSISSRIHAINNLFLVSDPNDASEGGKLKMILQLVKRSLGVKDIAAMLAIPFLSLLYYVTHLMSCSAPL